MYNFVAGPSALNAQVYTGAAKAVTDYGDGLSLLELSHRSKEFDDILGELNELAAELINLPAGYTILWLHGGASLQFGMVPYNFLSCSSKATYIDTGIWAAKAIKEARLCGNVVIGASSAGGDYSYLPDIKDAPGSRYLHYTSNNTVYGTQYKSTPKVSVPLVCDMSSDIFSKPVKVADYALIYAGAQKNIGTAGVCMVVINNDFADTANGGLLSMLDYKQHMKANSRLNTPPVFAMYVALLNLRWLKANGGVAAFETLNAKKAATLYATIDRNSLYAGFCEKNVRSDMNVCFRLTEEALDAEFIRFCEGEGLMNLAGHRTVGGFRASLYNAMPLEGAVALANAMDYFAAKKG